MGEEDDLPSTDAYRSMVAARLAAHGPVVTDLLRGLASGDLPVGTDHLLMEVFDDGLADGLPIHLSAFDARRVQIAPTPAIVRVNDGARALGAIVPPEAEDPFIRWETAADGGRIQAIRQPVVDEADISGTVVIPFLKTCGEAAGLAGLQVPTRIGRHDTASSELAFAPARGWLARLLGR